MKMGYENGPLPFGPRAIQRSELTVYRRTVNQNSSGVFIWKLQTERSQSGKHNQCGYDILGLRCCHDCDRPFSLSTDRGLYRKKAPVTPVECLAFCSPLPSACPATSRQTNMSTCDLSGVNTGMCLSWKHGSGPRKGAAPQAHLQVSPGNILEVGTEGRSLGHAGEQTSLGTSDNGSPEESL
jgi:hypothetical protein